MFSVSSLCSGLITKPQMFLPWVQFVFVKPNCCPIKLFFLHQSSASQRKRSEEEEWGRAASSPQKPFHYPSSSCCWGAQTHDGHAIKEANESTTRRSLLFLLFLSVSSWLISRAACLLLAEEASSPLSSLTLKMDWNYSSVFFLHFTFAGRRRA